MSTICSWAKMLLKALSTVKTLGSSTICYHNPLRNWSAPGETAPQTLLNSVQGENLEDQRFAPYHDQARTGMSTFCSIISCSKRIGCDRRHFQPAVPPAAYRAQRVRKEDIGIEHEILGTSITCSGLGRSVSKDRMMSCNCIHHLRRKIVEKRHWKDCIDNLPQIPLLRPRQGRRSCPSATRQALLQRG